MDTTIEAIKAEAERLAKQVEVFDVKLLKAIDNIKKMHTELEASQEAYSFACNRLDDMGEAMINLERENGYLHDQQEEWVAQSKELNSEISRLREENRILKERLARLEAA